MRTTVSVCLKGSSKLRPKQRNLIELACEKSGALISDYFHAETVPSQLAFVWADLTFELLCNCKHRLLRSPRNADKILDRGLQQLFPSYSRRLYRYRKSILNSKRM